MINIRSFGGNIIMSQDNGTVEEILLLAGMAPCAGESCEYCQKELSHAYDAKLPLRDIIDDYDRVWTYTGISQEIAADDGSCWEQIHRWTTPKWGKMSEDEIFESVRKLAKEMTSASELPALDYLFLGCMVDVVFFDKEDKKIAA